MGCTYFNQLSQVEQQQLLVNAKVLKELNDGFVTYTLYKLENYYIEVRSSSQKIFRRNVTAYELKDLPLVYSSVVFENLGTT